MSLRLRLLAAASVLPILVAAGLATVVLRQRTALYDQLDFQVNLAAGGISRAPVGAIAAEQLLAPPDPRPGSSDFYVGRLFDDGTVSDLAVPLSETRFVPDTEGLVARAQPPSPAGNFEVITVASAVDDSQARMVVIDLNPDIRLMVARPTTQVDEAIDQLMTTAATVWLTVVAALTLVLWWVDRLGLQPISRLTRAVEEVANGGSDHRVDHPPTSTETGRLGAAFNVMVDGKQRAERRQRQFVANASHELRTPLTTLQGYTALYERGGLQSVEQVDDAMRRISSEAARMSTMVDDLLTLASLDEERPLDRRPVDLSRLLLDVASDAAAVQPDRPVDVDRVANGIIVPADQHLLIQALTAITTNALRHTPTTSGLAIEASIAGAPRSIHERAVVSVSDEGPGIDPDQLPHLFDRFYKGRTGPEGSKGRGLGLAIAKTVIESHGGRIEATSDSEEGTTITFHLPLAGPSAQSVQPGGSVADQ